MTWGQLVAGVTSAVLVLIGTWISSKFSARVGHQANAVKQSEHHTVDWSTFAQEQRAERREERAWMERRLAERDQRIDNLERGLAARDDRIGALESRFAVLESRYQEAVAYIRRLVAQLRQHVPAHEIERPPEDIQVDLE